MHSPHHLMYLFIASNIYGDSFFSKLLSLYPFMFLHVESFCQKEINMPHIRYTRTLTLLHEQANNFIRQLGCENVNLGISNVLKTQ